MQPTQRACIHRQHRPAKQMRINLKLRGLVGPYSTSWLVRELSMALSVCKSLEKCPEEKIKIFLHFRWSPTFPIDNSLFARGFIENFPVWMSNPLWMKITYNFCFPKTLPEFCKFCLVLCGCLRVKFNSFCGCVFSFGNFHSNVLV